MNFDKSILEKNNCYTFDEPSHTYHWNGKKVEVSVTKFISQYFSEFDTDRISAFYAKKHGMLQEDVKKMWAESGNVSAMSGTIVHAFLEASNLGIGDTFEPDYTKAINEGLDDRVHDRVDILMPKARNFLAYSKDILEPIAMEYTVGLEDKLAGNIDLLAWNKEDKEIQIWDYKNLKAMQFNNKYSKCFSPFNDLDDCNFCHYSMQLSFYKAMAQRLLGIEIGKLRLVHFNYTKINNSFDVYEAIDLSDICNKELDKLLIPKKVEQPKKLFISRGIYGNVDF